MTMTDLPPSHHRPAFRKRRAQLPAHDRRKRASPAEVLHSPALTHQVTQSSLIPRPRERKGARENVSCVPLTKVGRGHFGSHPPPHHFPGCDRRQRASPAATPRSPASTHQVTPSCLIPSPREGRGARENVSCVLTSIPSRNVIILPVLTDAAVAIGGLLVRCRYRWMRTTKLRHRCEN